MGLSLVSLGHAWSVCCEGSGKAKHVPFFDVISYSTLLGRYLLLHLGRSIGGLHDLCTTLPDRILTHFGLEFTAREPRTPLSTGIYYSHHGPPLTTHSTHSLHCLLKFPQPSAPPSCAKPSPSLRPPLNLAQTQNPSLPPHRPQQPSTPR